MTRNEVFTELEKQGITCVTVLFSGGNDEGGCDGITATKADGTTIDLPENDDLGEALVTPIYDKYYGFAGEFSVNGTLIWDVSSKTVKMSGDEYEYSGTYFESDL